MPDSACSPGMTPSCSYRMTGNNRTRQRRHRSGPDQRLTPAAARSTPSADRKRVMSFREPPFLRLLVRPRSLHSRHDEPRATGRQESGNLATRGRGTALATPDPPTAPQVRLSGQAQPRPRSPGAARLQIAACRCRACLTARAAIPRVAVRSAADCPPAPRRAASQHPRSDTGNGRSARRACASFARTITPANTQTRSCGPCAGRTVGSQVIFQASPAGSLPEDGGHRNPEQAVR